MSFVRSRAFKRAVLLAVLLTVVGFGVRRLLRPDRKPRTEPTARQADADPVILSAPAPRTTSSGNAVLGINEGVALPAIGMSRVLHSEQTLKRRVAMLRSLGATMVRANSHAWPNLEYSSWKGSFDEADRFMRTVGGAGLDVVVVIGPWPGTRTAYYTDEYVPKDLDGYAKWVEAVVERYDRDGADDMPGLARGVLAWEVDNEPDQHHLVAPRGGRDRVAGPLGEGDLIDDGRGEDDDAEDVEAEGERKKKPFETPQEYAQVLIVTSAAIRRSDPDARVLSGGIYRSAMPAGRRYLADVFAVPGAREAIDGLSLHCYFSSDNLSAVQRTMRTAKSLAPDLPVWITETSVPSHGPQGWVDDAWQAKMVAGIIGGFLADGADRVFWHSLVDAPLERQGPTGYATNSLFRGTLDGNTLRYEPKPSGDVFRRLAAHIAAADPASFAEIPVEGGRILETDAGWLVFDGEPAVPPEGRTVEDLVTGEVAVGAERATAPAWISR